MLQPKPRELQPQVEVPMILVKHRWKRNRSDVSGSVVLGFDKNGIAKVPDVGNNRPAVETYCRHSKGLAEIVTEDVIAPAAMEEAPLVSVEEAKGSKGSFKPVGKAPAEKEEVAPERVVGTLDVPAGMSGDEVVERLRGAAEVASEEVMTSAKEDKPPAEKPAKKKSPSKKKKTSGKKSKG
jgi:hypothetical protein